MKAKDFMKLNPSFRYIPILRRAFSTIAFIFLVTSFSLSAETLTFSVVGDVMCHKAQLDSAYDPKTKTWDFKPWFTEVKPYIELADIAIGNFETTLPGDPKKYAGYPEFGAPDELAIALKDAGFDILTTANNHSMDKGKKGVIRTVDVVKELGFIHLGTYRSKKEWEENRVLIVERKGIKMAMLNYTYGTNGIAVPPDVVVNLIHKNKIVEDMALARSMKPDVIIVLYHFGTEYLRFPDKYQKEMVDLALEEGADIILGGHPHVLQPFTKVETTDRFGNKKKRLVVYSLGNFVSNQLRRYTDGGVIFNFQLRKEDGIVHIEKISYIPVYVYKVPGIVQNKFFVIPTEKNLNNEMKLPEIPYKQMMVFHKDTVDHLKESMEQVKD